MASVADIMIRVGGDDSGLQRTLGNAQSSVRGMSDTAMRTGKTLTRNVTTPILGVAAAALTVGMKFDDQMARVRAISGATGKDFDRLRDQARHLGSTTRFSATEAAEGMEYLALAGWDVAEVTAAMPGMLNLASAAQLDLGRTADIVTDTMSAFGMEAGEAGRAADIFARTSSDANTKVDELGEAMSQSAGIASSAGMSLESTSAALGVLANNSLKGGRAGTTFNAVLRDLVNNAEDGSVAIGNANVEVFDAQGNWRDFGAIMADVDKATQGMTDAQRENALRSVFQQQSIQGVNYLLGEGVEAFAELEAANYGAAGSAEHMASIMEDTFGGSLRALRSQLEGVMIQLSDQLAPIMQDVVVPAIERVGRVISDAIEWFANLDGGTRRVIGGLVAAAAAAGPFLIAVGMLGKVMALALSPFALVIGAIALFVGGLIYAWHTSEAFREVVTAVWEAVKVAIGTAVEFVGEMLDQLSTWWSEHGEAVMERVSGLWEQVTELFTTAIDAVVAVVSWGVNAIQSFWDGFAGPFLASVGRMWDNITDWVERAWNAITQIIEGALQIVTGIFDVFAGIFTGDWRRVWDGIKAIFEGIWNAIAGFVRLVWATIETAIRNGIEAARVVINTVLNTIQTIWEGAWNAVKTFIESTWDNVTGAVSDGIDAVMDFISEMPDAIMGFFSDAGSWLIDAGKNIVQGLIDGIGNMVGSVGRKMDEVVSSITSRLPWSPAKAGPLRTHPPEEGGANIARMMGEGLASGDVGSAWDRELAKLTAVAVPDVARSSRASTSSVRVFLNDRDIVDRVLDEAGREIHLHSARG